MLERNVLLPAFAIRFGKNILTALLNWFQQIYDATGLTDLWIGAVAMAIVFSVILIPLRGGGDVTRGAFGDLVVNQINNKKASNSKSLRRSKTD